MENFVGLSLDESQNSRKKIEEIRKLKTKLKRLQDNVGYRNRRIKTLERIRKINEQKRSEDEMRAKFTKVLCTFSTDYSMIISSKNYTNFSFCSCLTILGISLDVGRK